MERFPEKLREARKAAEINQTQLGELTGVSQRSITDYERGEAVPRKATIRKLAKALGVTVEYLTNDSIDDPQANQREEERIENARESFGGKGAREFQALLDRNIALFAGGELSEEQKDVFMDAMSAAYFACKREAQKKFTPHSVKKDESVIPTDS